MRRHLCNRALVWFLLGVLVNFMLLGGATKTAAVEGVCVEGVGPSGERMPCESSTPRDTDSGGVRAAKDTSFLQSFLLWPIHLFVAIVALPFCTVTLDTGCIERVLKNSVEYSPPARLAASEPVQNIVKGLQDQPVARTEPKSEPAVVPRATPAEQPPTASTSARHTPPPPPPPLLPVMPSPDRTTWSGGFESAAGSWAIDLSNEALEKLRRLRAEARGGMLSWARDKVKDELLEHLPVGDLVKRNLEISKRWSTDSEEYLAVWGGLTSRSVTCLGSASPAGCDKLEAFVMAEHSKYGQNVREMAFQGVQEDIKGHLPQVQEPNPSPEPRMFSGSTDPHPDAFRWPSRRP